MQDYQLLRQFSEIAAQQLNLPTKDDVASVARLSMQLEEKLDQIEDQLVKLREEIRSEKPQERDSHTRGRTKKDPKRNEVQQSTENREKANSNAAEAEATKTRKINLANLLTSICAKEFSNTIEETLLKRRKKRG